MLSCCGISGAEDWLNRTGFIPGMCCNSTTLCHEVNIYMYTGCMSQLYAKIVPFIELFIRAAVAACIDEAICILLTIYFWRKIVQIKRRFKSPQAKIFIPSRVRTAGVLETKIYI